MTHWPDDPPPAANENIDPFLRADTALSELYRLRRQVLATETGARTLEWWREHRAVLKKLDGAIRRCLAEMPG
jgi:hypothetical protein